MNVLRHRLDDELRVSAVPATVAMGIAGVATLLMAAAQARTALPLEMQVLGLGGLGLAVVNGLVHTRSPRAAGWTVVASLVVLIFAAERLLRVPGALDLLGLPVALAAAIVGLPGATLLALCESILVISGSALAALNIPGQTLGLALTAIWVTLGFMVLVYHPILERAERLEALSAQALEALREARERKTELAQMREDWLNASRQIQLANERLAALRTVAEEARQSKAAFVANVSHELRTPLNIITGLVRVLVDDPHILGGDLPPRAMHYLQTIYRNSQHLVSMIDDVLDLSQVEAGRLALHLAWSDLREVIASATQAIQPLVDRKDLQLKTIVPDDLPPVYCDALRIRQVILNLLSNAVRLTVEGSITVEAAQQDGDVVLSVTDTGPGISPEAASRIFEPFSHPWTQQWADRSGSGLGLSISKQLIKLHGGRMWLESTLGRGTTFHIALPLGGPAGAAARPHWRIAEDWMWRERAFHSERAGLAEQVFAPRIVVCDPSPELCTALARYSEGAEYVWAPSLAQALHELQAFPTLALMINAAALHDLWPLMEAARRASPDTPILGCACPPALEHALRAGAIGYLTKPVRPDDLAAVIAQSQHKIQRILVVDDEPEVRELMPLLLQTLDREIEVLTAASGADALRQMREAQPDLVLLDLRMPDMNGWETLAAAQADAALRHIPVVMVSGQDAREGPIRSPLIALTTGTGLPLSQLLEWSCVLPLRLRQAHSALHPAQP